MREVDLKRAEMADYRRIARLIRFVEEGALDFSSFSRQISLVLLRGGHRVGDKPRVTAAVMAHLDELAGDLSPEAIMAGVFILGAVERDKKTIPFWTRFLERRERLSGEVLPHDADDEVKVVIREYLAWREEG